MAKILAELRERVLLAEMAGNSRRVDALGRTLRLAQELYDDKRRIARAEVG